MDMFGYMYIGIGLVVGQCTIMLLLYTISKDEEFLDPVGFVNSILIGCGGGVVWPIWVSIIIIVIIGFGMYKALKAYRHGH